MGFAAVVGFCFLSLLFFAHHLLSHPLCIDSSYPITLKSPLKFCPYNVSSCCNATQDVHLQKQFQSMNVSNSACASIIKSILCAQCDEFSSELFRFDGKNSAVPNLCNSTASQADTNFCSKVWNTCLNVTVLNSPFAPLLQGQGGPQINSKLTKITDLWRSNSDFCNAFGKSSNNDSMCFDGEPVTLNATGPPSAPSGLCLEKIGNGSYLDMVPHPDGSNRAFFSSQEGKIWLATLPKQGSNGVIELDESSPFLDLSDIVHLDAQFGLMSIAAHPKFSENGRFFASFNCDKTSWSACGGRCACNSDVNCDPSKLPPDNGAQPCQYQTVISEFTVNGSNSRPTMATSADPTEVRRILTIGLPFTSHHGGQILFGPDGFLYFMLGDGGGDGDPYNFSQNKKSLLGKIMRLDVDKVPTAADRSTLDLWGNYSIPKDNPYIGDIHSQPEIWALGLRNPWRCSFDAERPSYFMCADVGQDKYEEVDIITKGGNYGWRVYEGTYLHTPSTSPGGNTSKNSIINLIYPVMGYNHSAVNSKEGSASITGGFFYRSSTDPCMYGRYLYADLYGGPIWQGTEFPENSGNFSTDILSIGCATDSPMHCSSVSGSSAPSMGYIFSFGEDVNKDIYVLTSNGVYRIVRPSRCKYTCSKENMTDVPTIGIGPTPSQADATQLSKDIYRRFVFLLSFLVFFVINW